MPNNQVEADFQSWMLRVNHCVETNNEHGLGVEDIEDWTYWEDFRAGQTPLTSANRALKHARGE